jgi:hypothetical protein
MDWKTCYLVFEGGRFPYLQYLQRHEDVITSLEGFSEIEEDLPELARWLETAKHRDTYEIGDFTVVVFEAPKLFIEVCEDMDDAARRLCEIDLDNLRVLDKRNGKVYTQVSSLEWHNSHVAVHVYDPEEEYLLFGMEWPVDCIILIDDNSRMYSCDWCGLCDGEDIDKA